MKYLLTILLLLSSFFYVNAQKQDETAIRKALSTYISKLESLDTTGVTALFVPGAQVFEGGKDEGGIKGYLDHHLAPELKDFKSFKYSDYKANVKVTGDYAFTTETYKYTIVLAKDDSIIRSMGVATSVFRKTKNGWKIEMTHGSYRKLK